MTAPLALAVMLNIVAIELAALKLTNVPKKLITVLTMVLVPRLLVPLNVHVLHVTKETE